MTNLLTDTLPEVPFSIYFLNSDGEVWPKRIYTVTATRKLNRMGQLEFYVKEFKKYMVYHPKMIKYVSQVFVN